MIDKDKSILNNLIKRMKDREASPLRPLIDEYLIKRVSSEQRYEHHLAPLVARVRPGGRLSPSTIGGCKRQAALRFIGVRGRRRLDPDLELVFDHGNWTHHKWQATFYDMAKVLGEEKFKVHSVEEDIQIPELFIKGSLDARISINSDKYVVDIKSINDYGFGSVYQTNKPKAEHVKQLTTYMKARKTWLGLLLYENKNNQQTLEFVVKFSKSVWEETELWCRSVLRSLRNRELPDMHEECQAGNFLWEKCPYAYLCYGTKTESQIEEKAFKGFESIKKAWVKGNREYQESLGSNE